MILYVLTSWSMMEKCIFKFALFSVSVLWECGFLKIVCGVCLCALFVTLHAVVERWVACHYIVFDIGGTRMMICNYHYSGEGLH